MRFGAVDAAVPDGSVNVAKINVATSGTDFTEFEADAATNEVH
jgi:hypothetical protein